MRRKISISIITSTLLLCLWHTVSALFGNDPIPSIDDDIAGALLLSLTSAISLVVAIALLVAMLSFIMHALR